MAYGTGGDIPPGQYTYGDPKAAPGKSYKDPNSTRPGVFFPIGTGPNQDPIVDGRPGHAKVRHDIGFHFDGGNPGTNGCIGYQQIGAQDSLTNDPDKTLTVHPYSSSLAETRAAIEAKVGKVDWDKVEEGRRHWPGEGPVQATDVHSKTKKGHKVKKGSTSVNSGPKARQTAHLESPLESGDQVADASKTVFVDPAQKRVARVNDQTTDGSPLADGVGSILVG
jgi:uncharacterized Zn-binding protein involved in type VI secretion